MSAPPLPPRLPPNRPNIPPRLPRRNKSPARGTHALTPPAPPPKLPPRDGKLSPPRKAVPRPPHRPASSPNIPKAPLRRLQKSPPPPGRPLPNRPISLAQSSPPAPPPPNNRNVNRPSPSKPTAPLPSNKKHVETPRSPNARVVPPSQMPDCSVWEGRFTFRGNLPPPPRYTNCTKVYLGGNRRAVCPNFGDHIEVSTGPSPEVKKAAERDKKMAALQKEIEAAARKGDMNRVMELSKKMKELSQS